MNLYAILFCIFAFVLNAAIDQKKLLAQGPESDPVDNSFEVFGQEMSQSPTTSAAMSAAPELYREANVQNTTRENRNRSFLRSQWDKDFSQKRQDFIRASLTDPKFVRFIDAPSEPEFNDQLIYSVYFEAMIERIQILGEDSSDNRKLVIQSLIANIPAKKVFGPLAEEIRIFIETYLNMRTETPEDDSDAQNEKYDAFAQLVFEKIGELHKKFTSSESSTDILPYHQHQAYNALFALVFTMSKREEQLANFRTQTFKEILVLSQLIKQILTQELLDDQPKVSSAFETLTRYLRINFASKFPDFLRRKPSIHDQVFLKRLIIASAMEPFFIPDFSAMSLRDHPKKILTITKGILRFHYSTKISSADILSSCYLLSRAVIKEIINSTHLNNGILAKDLSNLLQLIKTLRYNLIPNHSSDVVKVLEMITSRAQESSLDELDQDFVESIGTYLYNTKLTRANANAIALRTQEVHKALETLLGELRKNLARPFYAKSHNFALRALAAFSTPRFKYTPTIRYDLEAQKIHRIDEKTSSENILDLEEVDDLNKDQVTEVEPPKATDSLVTHPESMVYETKFAAPSHIISQELKSQDEQSEWSRWYKALELKSSVYTPETISLEIYHEWIKRFSSTFSLMKKARADSNDAINYQNYLHVIIRILVNKNMLESMALFSDVKKQKIHETAGYNTYLIYPINQLKRKTITVEERQVFLLYLLNLLSKLPSEMLADADSIYAYDRAIRYTFERLAKVEATISQTNERTIGITNKEFIRAASILKDRVSKRRANIFSSSNIDYRPRAASTNKQLNQLSEPTSQSVSKVEGEKARLQPSSSHVQAPNPLGAFGSIDTSAFGSISLPCMDSFLGNQ